MLIQSSGTVERSEGDVASTTASGVWEGKDRRDIIENTVGSRFSKTSDPFRTHLKEKLGTRNALSTILNACDDGVNLLGWPSGRG